MFLSARRSPLSILHPSQPPVPRRWTTTMRATRSRLPWSIQSDRYGGITGIFLDGAFTGEIIQLYALHTHHVFQNDRCIQLEFRVSY